MFQNIKVDIIYYKTPTDFEMEFNLCGCCRMRLLTDKAPDRKSMVHNLARAVSRSRVIIIVGSLFGEEGILNTVAGAIGKPLSKIDNKLYGIADGTEISVINGATPLVTPDGYFGGCIIESGPQSMILLSDSKSVRKTIMTTLIHPYIEELCATELKAKAESAVSKPTEPEDKTQADSEIPDIPTVPPEPEMPAEPEALPESDEAVDLFSSSEDAYEADDSGAENIYIPDDGEDDITVEPTEEHTANAEPQPQEAETKPLSSFATAENDGVMLDGGMIFETDNYRSAAKDAYVSDDEESDFYIAPEKLHRSHTRRNNELYALDSDENMHYRTDDGMPELPRSFFKENLAMIIVLVILLLTAAILCYCIFAVPSKSGMTSTEYLRDIFDTLLGRR